MKMKLVVLAMGAVMSTVTVAADTTVLKTDMDKLSYSIGSDLGKNFTQQGIDVNPMVMGKGIEDGMKGGPLLLTDQQMKDVLNNFQKNLMAKRTADFNKKAEENKTKGGQKGIDSFLGLVCLWYPGYEWVFGGGEPQD